MLKSKLLKLLQGGIWSQKTPNAFSNPQTLTYNIHLYFCENFTNLL